MRTNSVGRLILNNATVHYHAPNPEDLSKRRIISDVRIRARTTTEPLRRLLADCLSLIFRRCSPPNHPRTLKITYRNENFLLYDGVKNDGERFILFSTPCQLNILSRSSNIYFDSPIKSVPEIFYQLFVIQ
ncbi:hypothetical protein HZS_3812 [Henneguya salminicola]|nr:hypothetical protein HZS_3812 [Henneguya salminicola]